MFTLRFVIASRLEKTIDCIFEPYGEVVEIESGARREATIAFSADNAEDAIPTLELVVRDGGLTAYLSTYTKTGEVPAIVTLKS